MVGGAIAQARIGGGGVEWTTKPKGGERAFALILAA